MKHYNWCRIFLVVIFLILLTVIFILYRLNSLKVPPANIKFSDIKKNLRTGDLLLVPYDSIYGSLVKIFKGCYWTHTSLIYKKGNDIYVIEVARYESDNGKIYKGLLTIPLDKWLKFNKGRHIGYCKYKGREPNQHKVEKLLTRFKNIKANLNTVYWLNTLVTWKYYYENRKKYFCTEFIAKLLQDLNMIDKKYLPCNYSPLTFSQLSEYNQNIKICLI